MTNRTIIVPVIVQQIDRSRGDTYVAVGENASYAVRVLEALIDGDTASTTMLPGFVVLIEGRPAGLRLASAPVYISCYPLACTAQCIGCTGVMRPIGRAFVCVECGTTLSDVA